MVSVPQPRVARLRGDRAARPVAAPAASSTRDAITGVLLAPWCHMSLRSVLSACLLAAAVLATACGGSTPSEPTSTPAPTPTPAPDVYVAGFGGNVAKVWKNGLTTPLTDGTKESDAYSVAISGSDVYVAGYESNGTHWVAKVGKNGVATPLTDGTHDAHAYSIAVSPH